MTTIMYVFVVLCWKSALSGGMSEDNFCCIFQSLSYRHTKYRRLVIAFAIHSVYPLFHLSALRFYALLIFWKSSLGVVYMAVHMAVQIGLGLCHS